MPFRGPRDYFELGTWNATCQICGLKRKGNELTKRWDGYQCCKPSVQPGCWNPRQSQDYVRGVKDDQSPPFTLPPGEPQFVDESLRPNQVLGDDPE